MKIQYLVSFIALVALVNLQCIAQESDRAFPFLEELDVFSGTFEGTAVIPSGSAASERLGEVEGKTVTIIETSRWAPGKCAQIVDTSYKIDGTETILGTMLIGWDQNKQAMTTTMFTTHKGVWTGTARLEGGIFLMPTTHKVGIRTPCLICQEPTLRSPLLRCQSCGRRHLRPSSVISRTL